MKQYCCVNKLKPEFVKAYSDYHINAHKTEWKTQITALKKAGAAVCNVYVWEDTSILIIECDDLDECFKRLAEDPDNLRWQRLMANFFAENPKFDGTNTIYATKVFALNEI